jgi:uncharacterized protein
MPLPPDLPTRLPSTLDLDRLPWFERRDGRLTLRPGLGPIFDTHTHLSLAWLPFARPDLAAERPMRHLLPVERELDLDVYINRNLSPDDFATLKRSFARTGLDRRLPWAGHTLPNLLREMDDVGVSHCVLLPLDLPVIGHNARRYLRVTRGVDRIVCFGSVHPFQPAMARTLDRQIAWGARGVKFHPAAMLTPPSHPRAMKLYRLCGERGLPVFWHCGPTGIESAGMARRTRVEGYREAIEQHPGTAFVLGHSGALELDVALELANANDHVWLDTACQSISCVQRILDEADPARILQGSDWPFYHQAISVAKVLAVTEDKPELRAAVLRGNAYRLFGIPT